MTQDEIIKMAREAGGCEVDEVDPQCFIGLMAFEVWELERFAALIAAAERERIEAERLKKLPSPRPLWGGCPVCSIGSKPGAYGVVCTRGDCPTRVTCTGAV